MNPNNINDNLIKENYAYIKKWADSIPVTAAGYKNFGEIWDVVFEKKQAVDLFKEIHSLYPTGLDADVKAMNQGNELIIYFIKVIERDTQKVIYDAGNSFNSAQQRLDNKKQFWKEKYPENKYSVKEISELYYTVPFFTLSGMPKEEKEFFIYTPKLLALFVEYSFRKITNDEINKRLDIKKKQQLSNSKITLTNKIINHQPTWITILAIFGIWSFTVLVELIISFPFIFERYLNRWQSIFQNIVDFFKQTLM